MTVQEMRANREKEHGRGNFLPPNLEGNELMKFFRLIFTSLTLLFVLSMSALSQSWQPLTNQPSIGAGVPLLLTDGTVIVQSVESSVWWRLTPNVFGDYVNGTWTQIASMPSGYGPLYYASAVLADGRVVVMGGEYNISGSAVWTNLGAIYDPIANSWNTLAPPSGWSQIGDAECVVLPDGRLMMAHPFDTLSAILDPVNLTWTSGGTGKLDRYDEEGWTLLPEGTVLTTDALNAPFAEKYNPATNTWISAGQTPVSLEDPGSQEIGPAVLRPNGTVFATGATNNTAIYTPGASPTDPGTWAAGPFFPVTGGFNNLDIADGPACLLPNGNVLCGASPGVFNNPTFFFEFDGTHLNQVPATPRSSGNPSYVGNMLMLPSGQVMYTDFSSDVEIYTPIGSPNNAWRPTISSCPTTVMSGQKYAIQGKQFNGLSQCSAYGDDSTNATNYPLVRIKNNATGHVTYCRTSGHSTMAVATGATPTSTNFQLPAVIESGVSTLEVVANGISSTAFALIVSSPVTLTSVTVTPSAIPSGTTAIGKVTLASAAPAGGVVVNLTNTNTHATVPASVTVPAGSSSAVFSITASVVNATFSGAVNATYAAVTKSKVYTVVAAALKSVTLSPTSVIGGVQNSTATVTFTGKVAANTTVTLVSSIISAATVPSSVVVAANTSSTTFPVTSHGVTATQLPIIKGTVGALSKTSTLTVKPISILSLTLLPTSVKGGVSSTATIKLVSPAAVALTVTISSNLPLVAKPVSAAVTFTVGQQTKTVSIQTFTVLATTTATIKAVGFNTKTASLKVTP